MKDRTPAVWPLVADFREMTAAWDAGPARILLSGALRSFVTPRLRTVIAYRSGAWCWKHRMRAIALYLQARAIGAAGAEIHPAAEIGPGLSLIHSVGIVVGHEVVAGPNLVLYQGVTLGHTGRGPGQPQLGREVRVGAGAKILGPVRVGDRAKIGANAVVLADVPADATVVGVWQGAGRTAHESAGSDGRDHGVHALHEPGEREPARVIDHDLT